MYANSKHHPLCVCHHYPLRHRDAVQSRVSESAVQTNVNSVQNDRLTDWLVELNRHESMMGSINDPEDGKSVAATVFGAVVVYAVSRLPLATAAFVGSTD